MSDIPPVAWSDLAANARLVKLLIVANIVLRERMWGGGYVGTMSAQPALSWSDRNALAQAARGSAETAMQMRSLSVGVRFIAEQLAGLGMTEAMLIQGLDRLESELGLRLDQQTAALTTQSSYLARIDETLRTPAKTRAAERISDSGELLKRGRWERALAVANEAIQDDPNNPAGFRAAGWALLGLDRPEEARQSFFECAEAADGDERAQALRQTARVEIGLERPREALGLLALIDDTAGVAERRAADYDRAIYLAETGAVDEAKELIQRVISADEWFAWEALHDDLIRAHAPLTDLVRAYFDDVVAGLAELRRQIETDVAQGRAALADRAVNAEGNYPKWAQGERATLLKGMADLDERVANGRSRHHGRLGELRLELQDELAPEAVTLRTQALRWQTGLDDALTELAREREALAGRQKALSPVRDALQARVDETARRLAVQESGEVDSWTPWITLAPDVVVRSALVRRPAKRFKPEQRWLVTLNDSHDDVTVQKLP